MTFGRNGTIAFTVIVADLRLPYSKLSTKRSKTKSPLKESKIRLQPVNACNFGSPDRKSLFHSMADDSAICTHSTYEEDDSLHFSNGLLNWATRFYGIVTLGLRLGLVRLGTLFTIGFVLLKLTLVKLECFCLI